MKVKVSDFIAKYIESKGIKHVFELSGGMITQLLDSFYSKTGVEIVSMHHEQAAAFAADAYGRVSYLPGIALATSGPGATNLLTGIGSCFFDSSPAIFITGQVNTHELKGDRDIRQLGFQETDIVSMSRPITKKSIQVNNPEDIPAILEDAFLTATSGRPGPVLIDIPMNIQRALIRVKLPAVRKEKKLHSVSASNMTALYKAIKNSRKPLLLLGRGVKTAPVEKELTEFIKITKLPVVTSLLGLDAIGYHSEQRVGFIGSYGNRWANMALGECDLLVVLGSRLDIRQTGADTVFFGNRTIFHIDCEKGEINNRIKGCTPVLADIRSFLQSFNKKFEKNSSFPDTLSWLQEIRKLHKKWPDEKELSCEGINPNSFMHVLSANSSKAGAYVADVGAHQMWAAQSLELRDGQLFLTSGGMGAMGFALPAAIGACLAMKKKSIVAIIGDGSMQINLQELQTIVRNKLPVKIIVVNNRSLGMITQFQQSYFEERYQSTLWGYSAPDFKKIGVAFGIPSKTITKPSQMQDAVKWMWSKELSDKPVLLQVMIAPLTNIFPKIAFGKPLTEMEPFAKPVEIEST